MTKQPLDKKTVKISVSESPDEQDYYNWNINFSSDEDIFLKGKSEILWSRTRDWFNSPDSYQSVSDFTGRTLSSCSWHNDEFDMKSSGKVNASLEAIDDALYEKVKSSFLNDTLFRECCDWAEKFSYFRIKGQQIISIGSENYMPYSVSASNVKDSDLRSPSPSLHLEGRKLTIHSANKLKGQHVENIVDSKIASCIEEVIDDGGGKHEEYFALHKSDEPSDIIQVPMNDNSVVPSAIKLLQEKVLDKLISGMWPRVLTFLEKFDNRSINNISNDLQLPPITVSNEHRKSFCLKRPNTEGSGIIITEFPKLDSILTVSPKILQRREHGCISRIARPNSEMSVNPRVSSKSIKSVYCHSHDIQINSEFSQFKGSKSDKETEGLNLVLPALQEDFQDASILRGFHIEPGTRNSSNRIVHSSKNEYETFNSSRENDYFLPPIEDKNYVPSNINLTKNLFTFYGSPIMQDKSKYPGSAKYKKSNSRPNTSVSKKVIKNHEVSEQVPVNSRLYITAKGKSKISSNLYAEKCSDITVINSETVEESQEKSVTLFPIVTSLIPHEDKNNSVKKGILHTFLGGRKR